MDGMQPVKYDPPPPVKLTVTHAAQVEPDLIEKLTDPAFNVGSVRSHQQVFDANGTKGDDILRHPHFLPYPPLLYPRAEPAQ